MNSFKNYYCTSNDNDIFLEEWMLSMILSWVGEHSSPEGTCKLSFLLQNTLNIWIKAISFDLGCWENVAWKGMPVLRKPREWRVKLLYPVFAKNCMIIFYSRILKHSEMP